MKEMDEIRLKKIIDSAKRKLAELKSEEFSEDTKKEAWLSATGRCESCGKKLVLGNHNEGEPGAWEAHHIVPKSDGGLSDLQNCQVLCLDCHKKTDSYGMHD